VEIYQNNNLLCDSQAKYAKGAPAHSHQHGGGTSSGMTGMAGMRKMKRQGPPGQIIQGGDYNNNDIPHIADIERCNYIQGKPLKAGDGLYIAANYDFEAHPGVKDGEGKVDMIMGMAGVLIGSRDL